MPKVNIVIINKVKIMSRNIEDKAKDDWAFSIGFYPGILFGVRSYDEPTQTAHVFYLPFIDFALEIYK